MPCHRREASRSWHHIGSLSLSLSLSLCLLTLLALDAPSAVAQPTCGASGHEILVDFAGFDVTVNVYDASGDVLPSAPLNDDEEESGGFCDWYADFDFNLSPHRCTQYGYDFCAPPQLITIEFVIQYGWDSFVYRYAYYPSNYGPQIPPVPNNPVIDWYDFYDNGDYVTPDVGFRPFMIEGVPVMRAFPKAPMESIENSYEHSFPSGQFVMPHEWAHYAATAPNPGSAPNHFLTVVSAAGDPPDLLAQPVYQFSGMTDVPVPAGRDWIWDIPDLTLRFPEGTKLVVNGALAASSVTFRADYSVQPWGGILVDGGVATLNGGVIEYATTGLDVRSVGNTITGTTIRYNGAGVRTYPTKNGNSSLSLSEVIVTDNTGNGVYAAGTFLEMVESAVTNNGGTGVVVAGSIAEEFTNNIVTGNGLLGGQGSDGYAVAVGAQGELDLSPQQRPGLNWLAQSATTELWVSEGATSVFAGSSQANGHNTIEDAAGMLVRVPTGFAIPAMYNYWGDVDGLDPARVFGGGSVTSCPWLSCDPLTCTPQVHQCQGLTVTSDAFAGGGSGHGGPLGALREEIRRYRELLRAVPESPSAASLVHGLLSLQRSDREDTLGERAETMGLLAGLRIRLRTGSLPAALRPAAEAALAAEVADAMAREDYLGVRLLLHEYGASVQGANARRRLSVAEALLFAHDERFEAAASALVDVADGVGDVEERDGLLALAAHLAAGAGIAVEPREAQVVAGSPRDTGVILAVAPNPVRASGSVRLTLAGPAHVRLSVRDVLGREVSVLTEATYASGVVAFAMPAMPVGVYVVRARVEVDGAAPHTLSRSFTVVR